MYALLHMSCMSASTHCILEGVFRNTPLILVTLLKMELKCWSNLPVYAHCLRICNKRQTCLIAINHRMRGWNAGLMYHCCLLTCLAACDTLLCVSFKLGSLDLGFEKEYTLLRALSPVVTDTSLRISYSSLR
jgi:hypothetical protein